MSKEHMGKVIEAIDDLEYAISSIWSSFESAGTKKDRQFLKDRIHYIQNECNMLRENYGIFE